VNYGTVRVLSATAYGVHRYGCSVGKRYTRIKLWLCSKFYCVVCTFLKIYIFLDLEDLSVESHMTKFKAARDFVHHLELRHVCGCAFSAFASSHHHHTMNFYHIFLLLLVILSAYSESPQHGKPPDSLDSTVATVCPNSSSDSLGVLAPVLPQNEVLDLFSLRTCENEMFGSVQSQNMVLPQSEVFGSQNVILPQNEVYRTNVLLQSEVFRSQNMILPQNEVF